MYCGCRQAARIFQTPIRWSKKFPGKLFPKKTSLSTAKGLIVAWECGAIIAPLLARFSTIDCALFFDNMMRAGACAQTRTAFNWTLRGFVSVSGEWEDNQTRVHLGIATCKFAHLRISNIECTEPPNTEEISLSNQAKEKVWKGWPAFKWLVDKYFSWRVNFYVSMSIAASVGVHKWISIIVCMILKAICNSFFLCIISE